MTRYYVITPEYVTRKGGYYDPPEYGADIVEVDAPNKRQAKVLGVRLLRKLSHSRLTVYNDENPFRGLRVEIVEEVSNV